jgi:D-lactate dehydrogenase
MQLLRDRLDWQPKLNAVEVHVPCSAKIGQGTAASEAAISELLRGTALPEGAPIASSGVSCCGMAGDRGLRFPELVQAATSSRGPRLAESSCRATRVSISRTCEIAMAAESLPVILDNCASPLKLR